MAGRAVIIDESSAFGARVAKHLREEVVVWMTTVTPSGAPLPMPVWFLWEGGESLVMFSRESPRVRNVEANPNVSLNFDGDGRGGGIVVLSGRATVDRDGPRAHLVGAYIEKYAGQIERIGHTPESFGGTYSVPIRIELTRLRGH
jgi:PPOX class probable F420-dependent enzyme